MIAPDSKMPIGAPPPFGSSIDDRGHAVVGADLQEVVGELIAAADVERDHLVGRSPASSSRIVTFFPFGVGQ